MSSETKPMNSTLIPQAINDKTHHDIMSMLERPVFTPPVEWTAASPALSFNYTLAQYDARTVNYLAQYDFPQTIFENSAVAVEKLTHFQYLNSDLEIELKINPNPNLRGALLMVYKPYNANMLAYRRFSNQFMASQTTFPHKILSMEEANSVKMIVPYTNIYDSFDLGNSDNQFGTVTIYVLAPLQGTEATAATQISLNCRFINPKFSVATQRDVLSTYQDSFALARLKSRGIPYAQSGGAPLVAADTGEVVTTGPVSKVSAGVSMISEVLSGVPGIGKIAASVNWASRIVNHSAAAFGLSKPTSIQPQSKMVVKPAQSMMHSEGHSDATTLALINDNGIDGSTFIPEICDEMSFPYILAQPNIFHAVRATDVLFKDRKLITAWEVSPFSQYQYTFGGSNDTDTLFMGSFGYTCANFATLWRGTINYDIQMIKTCFHRGRYLIAFLPETNLADVPPTLGQIASQTYNAVVNLQDRADELGRTAIRFSVPYTANTPWRETFKLTNGSPDATTLDTKTGCVAIYSLIDLSVNEGIADPAMDFYISHSAGEDFQLGRPTLQLAPGYNGAYAQSDHGRVYIPQDDNLLISSSTTADVTGGTTGEYYTGLRQIVKRFGRCFNVSSTNDYVGIKTRTFREINGLNATGCRNVGTGELPLKGYPTPLYMASFLYTFMNGSSQLQVFPRDSATTIDSYLRFDEDSEFQTVVPRNDSIGQPIFQQLQTVSNVYEIRTPWYRGIRGDVMNSNQPPVLNDVRTCIRTRGPADASVTEDSEVFEAAGDDMNFYFLRGPPPMVSIKQVQMPDVPALPWNGIRYTVDFAQADISQGVAANQLVISMPTNSITPTPDLSVDRIYNIVSENPTSKYTVTFDDGTTEEFLVSGLLFSSLDGGAFLTETLATTKAIDATATAVTINAYGEQSFLSSFPTV